MDEGEGRKDRYRVGDREGEEERACPVCSLKGWLGRSFPSLHMIYIFPKCSLWFVVSLTLEKLYSHPNYDNKKHVFKKREKKNTTLHPLRGQRPNTAWQQCWKEPNLNEKRKVANLSDMLTIHCMFFMTL